MRVECNFDGLVGPSHHYGGLGVGNVASQSHGGQASSPLRAALQGLDKMGRLHQWGIPQAILPPAPRPAIDWLRRIGFRGDSDWQVVEDVAEHDPRWLTVAYSGSSMWAANIGTFAPSCDSLDRRAHLVIANLTSSVHRALEPASAVEALRRWLRAESCDVIEPLPAGWVWRDEGAANHMWLSRPDSSLGLHVLVHEPTDDPVVDQAPLARFPARQSRTASAAVARCLRLPPLATLLVAQHPAAIAAGVFHNDVIATSHQEVLLCHELAFEAGEAAVHAIAKRYLQRCGEPLRVRVITQQELSLKDAVASYLFNGQLVGPPSRRWGDPLWFVCPQQCREIPAAARLIERLQVEGFLDRVAFMELRESMRNGGGPACLRIRLQLTEDERAAVPRNAWYSTELDARLRSAISSTYPERIEPAWLGTRECFDRIVAAQRAVEAALGIESRTSENAR